MLCHGKWSKPSQDKMPRTKCPLKNVKRIMKSLEKITSLKEKKNGCIFCVLKTCRTKGFRMQANILHVKILGALCQNFLSWGRYGRYAMSSMPTLLDYLGVSRIQTESPGLPYRTPSLLDTRKSAWNTCLHMLFQGIFLDI